MVAVGPNMFYTVTLPCTLWFFDKGKGEARPRADTVLFLDARHIYRQIDRAHRDWTPAQIGFLANIVRLYRGEDLDFTLGGDEAEREARRKSSARKPQDIADVPGLCQAATLKEIEAQGWSLNPGRYVGVAPGEAVSDEDFKEQLETLNEELETLNAQARDLRNHDCEQRHRNPGSMNATPTFVSFPNPNGIVSISPGLRGAKLPWVDGRRCPQPQRGCVSPPCAKPQPLQG